MKFQLNVSTISVPLVLILAIMLWQCNYHSSVDNNVANISQSESEIVVTEVDGEFSREVTNEKLMVKNKPLLRIKETKTPSEELDNLDTPVKNDNNLTNIDNSYSESKVSLDTEDISACDGTSIEGPCAAFIKKAVEEANNRQIESMDSDINAINHLMENEAVNREWAQSIEAEIYRIFNESETYQGLIEKGLVFKSTNCRSTVCMVYFMSEKLQQPENMQQLFAIGYLVQINELLTNARMYTTREDNGDLTVSFKFPE